MSINMYLSQCKLRNLKDVWYKYTYKLCALLPPVKFNYFHAPVFSSWMRRRVVLCFRWPASSTPAPFLKPINTLPLINGARIPAPLPIIFLQPSSPVTTSDPLISARWSLSHPIHVNQYGIHNNNLNNLMI